MTTTYPILPNIRAWLEFIEERERRLHDVDSFEVAEGQQIEFQTVYGICAQAIRYAGAYAVLYRAGRSREAVAVARQALEHALTAQWAHFEETGPNQLIEGYYHSRERLFRVIEEFLKTPKDEIDSVLEPMAGKGKRLLRVTDMIEQVDFNALFRTAYTRQSQIVHVTSETVAAFLDVDEDNQFKILSEATDPHEHQTARFTAMAAMFASWVLESLRVDTPGLAELDQLADKLGLPLNIRD